MINKSASMNSFSIKTKVILIIVSVALSFSLMLLIEIIAEKNYLSLKKTIFFTKKVEIGILKLRRNEKYFLAQNSLNYHTKYIKNYIALQESVNNLNNQLNLSGIESERIIELKNILYDYKTDFVALVKSYQEKGVSNKTGLHGKIRTTVYKIEEKINILNEKLTAMINKKVSDITLLSSMLTLLLVIINIGFIIIVMRSIFRNAKYPDITMKNVEKNSDFTLRSGIKLKKEHGYGKLF